ncbi:hypothetical protein LMG28138_03060 [Pararobbsia alpina]|uniref:Uncharacterized protein n=2 Tax=Pararobbsia alpina TaxID=621374 RepID=A0A6S7B801_9BURK|nr:hypothetical protein LMG28138_03060 [Pararobbsia alpina]
MPLRIERAFGTGMDHLLRMQIAYDLAQARRHKSEIKVARYFPHRRNPPIALFPSKNPARLAISHRLQQGRQRASFHRISPMLQAISWKDREGVDFAACRSSCMQGGDVARVSCPVMSLCFPIFLT